MKTKIELMAMSIGFDDGPILEDQLQTLHENGCKVISVIPRIFGPSEGGRQVIKSVWIVAEVKA
jgi:hypothetical protein